MSIPATTFADGVGAEADARHLAMTKYRNWPGSEPTRAFVGRQAETTVGLVETLQGIKAPVPASSALVNQVVECRSLFQQNLGVEVAMVTQNGYDTHANQIQSQETLLNDLDAAIEAFYFGTAKGTNLGIGALPPALAARTLIMTISEFGRRIGENGGAAVGGTDHGAAAPVMLIGPPGGAAPRSKLVGGIHGDHPNMGTVALPADNLEMTTDLRKLIQSVLTSWLGNPDPAYDKIGAIPTLFKR